MKIKNLILGATATIFAIGGALASNSLVTGNYAQTAPRCRQIIPVDCGVAGENVCKALIETVSYPVYQNRSSTNVCTQPVTTVGTESLPSSFLD